MATSTTTAAFPISEDDVIHDPERLQEIVRLNLFSEEVQNILDEMAEQAAEELDRLREMADRTIEILENRAAES